VPYEVPRGREDALFVQVQGGAGEPERVFVLAPPDAGGVAVREIAADGVPTVRDYVAEPRELLARFEAALRERRRVSVELLRLREWLAGRG
jgi:hypothetical protein